MSGTCLVTGGAGFIGSHLVEALTGAGLRVRVLDDFSTGLDTNLAALQPMPEVVCGDVADPVAVNKAMKGVEVVFHLAALASVQRSLEAPEDTHRVCVTGTLNLLEAARKQGVRRFVYAGSSSAYGHPDSEIQTEDSPFRPLSPYAAAKLAGEMYLQSFTTSFGLETVRLRFFNVYGPRQRADSPYSGVIAIFAGALKAGKTPTIYGDGLQTRDFVYVSDVVQALQQASTVPGIAGRVYNIGTGRSITILDLVAALNRQGGTQIAPRHGPARSGDVRHSCADITRARRDLNFDPHITFEEGLKRTLA